MLKKVISLLLCALMVICLGACTAKDDGSKESVATTEPEVTLPEKKVLILTAPESQYPEDYAVAKALAAKYEGKIEVKEYADSRVAVAGDPEILTLSKKAAEDKNIGAIIYARATNYTYESIKAAKQINSDLVTIAIEPDNCLTLVSEVADLVIATDWGKYSTDIIAKAKEQGAEYFAFLSYKRHVADNPLYAQLTSQLKNACEEQGIEYVYADISDPVYDTPKVAKVNAVNTISGLFKSGKISGKNVVLFSTDSNCQANLAEYAGDNGLIYICPSFPTAYNGIYELTEMKAKTLDECIKAVKTQASQMSGQLSVYTYPLATVMQSAALCTAFDILSGKEGTPMDIATERLTAIAANEDFTTEIKIGDEKTVECYAPGFEILTTAE